MTKRNLKSGVVLLALTTLWSCGGDEADAAEENTKQVEVPEEVEAPDTPLAAGEKFYAAKQCGMCHMKSGDPLAAPSLDGADADTLLTFMNGSAPHTGGEVAGVTPEDAAALAAFFAAK